MQILINFIKYHNKLLLEVFMLHITLNDENCTGCYACVNICPKNCIFMKRNTEGFLYPIIDEDNCVNCGLCKSVCSIDSTSFENKEHKAYACFSKKEDIVKQSSSGGLFYEIASFILENGGYVCGAEYAEDFSVRHILINEKEDLYKLMKSKYVQSSINKVYLKIKDILYTGKQVLFMGTPCQVKGLKLYLKKDYDNLFCGEVVCHGVPSYKVLKKYTDYISNNSNIKSIDFRNKEDSWKNYSVKFEFENNEVNMNYEKCLYLLGFINNLYLRKSCYSCDCKMDKTEADFTLGDFWGVDKLRPDIDNDNGVSLYISHTNKGDVILKELKSEIFCEKIKDKKYIDFNPSIIKCAEKNKERKIFFKNIDKYDFGMLWDYVYSRNAIARSKVVLRNKLKNNVFYNKLKYKFKKI